MKILDIDVKTVYLFSGIFFILPCIDAYARVDLRTRTYDIPPQEVSTTNSNSVRVIKNVRLGKIN